MEATETTLTVKPPWGLTPPDGVVAAWGARAIYKYDRTAYDRNHTTRGKKKVRQVPYYSVDLLWDRMGGAGNNAKLQELTKWLDDVALPKLRKEIDFDIASEETWTFTDGQFTIAASPRASHGYLYIGAWVA